jgi:hypothetical protein
MTGSKLVKTSPTIIAYRHRRKIISSLMRKIKRQMLHLSSAMLVKRKICVIQVKKFTYS